VVDNLASLTPNIDENIKKDWDPINAWLLELRFAGIATVMLHHTNKEGGQRGTSAREDNIDITILLKHPPDYTPEDGARFIAHFMKSRFVDTHELPLIADTVFHLVEDDKGRLTWTWGNVKQEIRMEVLKLMDEGHRQTDVANILGITRGYVSQIVKSATKEGLLTPKGKLTQSGSRLLYEDEN
jgi:putative DNA primase/helicase